MYMNKYFEYGDFSREEFIELAKIIQLFREICHLMKTLHKEMMKDIQVRDKHRGTCLTDIFWEPMKNKSMNSL